MKGAKGWVGGQEGTCNRNSLVTSGPNYNMYKVWKSLLLLLWQISLQIKNQWLFLAVTGSLGCRETAILKSGEMGAFRDIQSWSFLSAKNRSSWSHKLVVVVFSCWVMSDSFATPWIVACQAPLSLGLHMQEYWSGLPFPSPGNGTCVSYIGRQILYHGATREATRYPILTYLSRVISFSSGR